MRLQNTERVFRNGWRAGYIERCKSGLEGGSRKPVPVTEQKALGVDPNHVKIAYATSNPDTARYLSESSSITTVVKEAESVSKDRGTLKRNISMSLQEVSRPLLTVDECMRLKGPEKDAQGRILTPGDMLIFAAGYAAVYGRQMLFFLDPEFRRRAKINAPEMSERTIEEAEVTETGISNLFPSPVAVKGKMEPDDPTSDTMKQLEQLGAIDAARVEDINLADIGPADIEPAGMEPADVPPTDVDLADIPPINISPTGVHVADADSANIDSDHEKNNKNEVTIV
jgi:hypothetical protein